MSGTKPCQHEPLLQLHGRTIAGTKRCKHCGLNEAYWGRTLSAYAPDPRIAAADAMAKALETLIDHGEPLRGDGELWSSWQIRVKDRIGARAALAAYNALR